MVTICNTVNGIKVVREVSYVIEPPVRKNCPWHGDCFRCKSAYSCEQSEALLQLNSVMV